MSDTRFYIQASIDLADEFIENPQNIDEIVSDLVCDDMTRLDWRLMKAFLQRISAHIHGMEDLY